MYIRVIKPMPKGPTLIGEHLVGGVTYEQDGAMVVDIATEAALVEDGKLEIMKDGVKVGEQPAFREPTDADVLARHRDAIYLAKKDDDGNVVEFIKPDGYVFGHTFNGWGK